ncbi:MAG: hypothetical protein ABMA13_19190 [Chthoniobacteraceae bacterium]
MSAPSSPTHNTSGTRWLLSHLDCGELGNRLVSYCWLLALAFEHRAAFTNLGFWRYARFFELSDDLIVRPWEAQRPPNAGSTLGTLRRFPPIERWVQRRCRFDGDIVFDVPSLTRRALAFTFSRLSRTLLDPFLDFQHDGAPGRPATTLTLATLKNWSCPTDDPSIIERHAPAIRAFLRPSAAICEQVAAFLDPLRRRHRALVGIHIRRGDYRVYREGRWFFGDEVYRAVMERFAELLGPEVGFVVASNDPVQPQSFAPFAVTPAPGHLMLDLFSLAGCDFIAGPPSTFSGCASYLGGKPVFWMTEPDARPADLAALKPWVPQLY